MENEQPHRLSIAAFAEASAAKGLYPSLSGGLSQLGWNVGSIFDASANPIRGGATIDGEDGSIAVQDDQPFASHDRPS
jgi:hypothetical protein